MKLLIIGMGNIGTAYGWALAEDGVDTTHLVRAGRKAAYADGIDLDVYDLRLYHPDTKQVRYRPRVIEEVPPDDHFDFVMVPTRHTQVADTVRELNDRLPEARFLIFCAGWYAPRVIDDVLPRSRYVWGYASSTGGHRQKTLVLNMSPTFRFGPIEGEYPPWAEEVATLFRRAAIAPDYKYDMVEWLWVHHAIVAALVGAAFSAGGLKEMMTDAGVLQDRLIPAARDALRVVEARGVDLRRYDDTRPYLELPAAAVAAEMIASAGSTWMSRTFAAGHFLGNAEEMRRFYLDVVETGEELGVEMPVLASFREKVVAG